MNPYPLKFKTIFKEKLWGGEKIKTVLGKDFSPLANCGETWELSGVQGNISEVANGSLQGMKLTELIQKEGASLVGQRIVDQFGEEFPLLIKFIDANQDLSIQVHPNDKLAQKRHNSFGKTEMWYIMQADKGSTLISGFNQRLNRDEFKEIFDKGEIMDVLNKEEAKAGDVFYLPSGRVHTIGKGLLLAEIQQTSDVTYRIYDFERVDDQGNKRELHVEESLEAIDYQIYDHYKTPYDDKLNHRVELVSSPYFTTNKLQLSENYQVDHKGLDCFKIYICLDGEARVNSEEHVTSLSLGEVLLVPAAIETYWIETSSEVTLLEAYIQK